MEFNLTVLNDACCFHAVGTGRKTNHKKGFADRNCGLYPYCDVMFNEDAEIGFATILEPENHPRYGGNAWVCWHHVDANLAGVKVQTQTSKRKHRKCSLEVGKVKSEEPRKSLKKSKSNEAKK